jgi:hypothetical protein
MQVNSVGYNADRIDGKDIVSNANARYNSNLVLYLRCDSSCVNEIGVEDSKLKCVSSCQQIRKR